VKDDARVPLLVGLVLGCVTIIAVAGALLDVQLRTAEADRLLVAVQASEDTMLTFRDDVIELYAAYGPALDELEGPGLVDPLGDPELEALYAEIDGAISEIAQTQGTALGHAMAEVRRVGMLPWHHDLAAAHRAYLAHAQTWLDLFDDVAAEPARLDEPRPEIDSTFYAAGDAMRQAVPAWAGADLHERVEEIFAVPDSDLGETA
jgi:hypothetical protein